MSLCHAEYWVGASGRYSLISPIGIPVLQSFGLENPSTLCISFSLTNVSHGYRYHKYDCYHLNYNSFYIFNIENAAYQGYTPCLDCLGSGSTEEIKDKLERDLY